MPQLYCKLKRKNGWNKLKQVPFSEVSYILLHSRSMEQSLLRPGTSGAEKFRSKCAWREAIERNDSCRSSIEGIERVPPVVLTSESWRRTIIPRVRYRGIGMFASNLLIRRRKLCLLNRWHNKPGFIGLEILSSVVVALNLMIARANHPLQSWSQRFHLQSVAVPSSSIGIGIRHVTSMQDDANVFVCIQMSDRFDWMLGLTKITDDPKDKGIARILTVPTCRTCWPLRGGQGLETPGAIWGISIQSVVVLAVRNQSLDEDTMDASRSVVAI